MRFPWAALFALCVAGCGPTLIVLKNSTTGQIVQCQGVNMSQIIAQNDAESCAKAYETQGFTRISN